MIDCHDFFSKSFDFWSHLTDAEKKLICENTKLVKYEKGQNIHSGSNDCVGVILVRSGQVRSYMLSKDGREITLYRLYAGDSCILSSSCALNAITFDVFLDAVEDCEILEINSAVFQEISEQNIYVEAFGYKLATTRFSDVMWAMEQILFMSFEKRLAIFLVDEMAKVGSSKLKLTHEQIAKYMGSAREVVSRMMKYFAGEGIVELSRGEISIIDKDKLRSFTK